jgi:acyl-CoA synthetase (AMP-forming)/AMP-acid ligase II
MRIENFLTASADRIGSETAVVAGGRRHSYAQLACAAGRIAAALADRGVKRGDRIGVLMETTPAAVAVTFGIMMAGGVVCVAGRALDAEGLAGFITGHSLAGLAIDARFAPVAAKALAGIANFGVVLLNGGGAMSGSSNCLSVAELTTRLGAASALSHGGTVEDAAMVLGSLDPAEKTARPITLSHGELAAGAGSTAPREGLVLRTMFTFAGFCHLAQAIRTGIAVVFEAPFEARRPAVLAVERSRFGPLLEAV